MQKVCQPTGDAVWNCPIRHETALWLLDKDERLYRAARRRDFSLIKNWFEPEDELTYWVVIEMYCIKMLDELCDEKGSADHTAWLELQKNARKMTDRLPPPT